MMLKILGRNVFHSCLTLGLLWRHCLYGCYNISRNYILSFMWGCQISSTFELQLLMSIITCTDLDRSYN